MQYGPGDLLELSEAEAAGFLDKLEKVKEPAGVTWGDLDKQVVDRLVAAGYSSLMSSSITDDELLAVDGIGPATLRKIREWQQRSK